MATGRNTKGGCQTTIPPIEIREKVHGSVLLDPRGPIANVHRHWPSQPNCCPHVVCNCLLQRVVCPGGVTQQVGSKVEGFLDANTAVTKCSDGAGEQTLGWRVVQVDTERTG